MEKLFETLGARVPELVALIVLVVLFFRYMARRDDANNITLERVNQTNLQAREDSRRVIEENTAAAKQNSIALTQMTDVLREFLYRQPTKIP